MYPDSRINPKPWARAPGLPLADIRDQAIQDLSRSTALEVDRAVATAFERKTGATFDKAVHLERMHVDHVQHSWTVYLDNEPLVCIEVAMAEFYEAAMEESPGSFIFGPRVVATYLAQEPDDVPF